MCNSGSFIALIPSAPPPLCSTLCKMLAAIGYTNTSILDSNELREPNLDARYTAFIFPICRSSSLKLNMRLALQRIRFRRPVLGVLWGPEKRRRAEMLDWCDEYLYWPCSADEIVVRMERLFQLAALPACPAMPAGPGCLDPFVNLDMIGQSEAFLGVLEQIQQAARSEAPVMIEGQAGTGKEMGARAIHYLSNRREHPFISINCGAMPDTLLEHELAGHVKGDLTDAQGPQQGLIGQADKGTIFLGQIETLSPKGQAVLLRFLQDRRYKLLGGAQAQQADVRVIAAGNCKLAALVADPKFRQDHFYRLNIIAIRMPALRERSGDVELLAQHFFEKFRRQHNQPHKRLDRKSLKRMRHYCWPGNVGELEDLVHREFLTGNDAVIRLDRGLHRAQDCRRDLDDPRPNLQTTELFKNPEQES